jgi:L-fuconolactonase
VRLDAHHHFWRYDPAAFGWIDEPLRAIRRDFLPADLAPELRAAGIDGVVSVQARQTHEETDWLLACAARHDFVRGVVGWVDLRAPDVGARLDAFARHPKFRGARHVVQGEPDEGFLLRPDFNRGLAALGARGLAYDLLLRAPQLPAAARCVDLHPDQVFILDHLAKPPLRSGDLAAWRRDLRELARRGNVYGKVSGLTTEALPARWTEPALRACWDTALEAFGPRRLMLGTDWPVCTATCGYGGWVALVERWTAALGADERARVLGGTAAEAYRL